MVSEAQKRASAKCVRENVKRKTVSLFWGSADLAGNQTPEAGYDLFQQDPDEWTGPKKRMA